MERSGGQIVLGMDVLELRVKPLSLQGIPGLGHLRAGLIRVVGELTHVIAALGEGGEELLSDIIGNIRLGRTRCHAEN